MVGGGVRGCVTIRSLEIALKPLASHMLTTPFSNQKQRTARNPHD
jgi:hypothetical protein